MKQIQICLFALLKDQVGTNRLTLQIDDSARVTDLKSELKKLYPRADGTFTRAVTAINQEFAFDEDLIPDNAEVAFFPPVSGGSDLPTLCKIQDEPLNLDELVKFVTLPTTGAACSFTGMVRGETVRGEGHSTTSLEYEAYRPMAEAKMRQIATEIRNKWTSIEGIAIVQRIGLLDPGIPSVVIACSSAHRDSGVFDAARYGIDRLKEIVPVWKKEIGPNGEEWVEGDYQPDQGDRNL